MDQLVNSFTDPFVASLAALALVLLVMLVVTLWPKRRKPARRVPQPPPAVVHPDNDVTYPLFRRDEMVRREERERIRRELNMWWLPRSGRKRNFR